VVKKCQEYVTWELTKSRENSIDFVPRLIRSFLIGLDDKGQGWGCYSCILSLCQFLKTTHKTQKTLLQDHN
jgi:hypothetical protein